MLEMDAALFEERVDEFSEILSRDSRPIYATSIYGFSDPNMQESGRKFREIVEKYAKKRFFFTGGLEILNHSSYFSQDMVHPSIEGMDEIVKKWYSILTK